MIINSSSNNLSENEILMCVSNCSNSKKIRGGSIKNHNAPIKSHYGLINCFNGGILQCEAYEMNVVKLRISGDKIY